ncbi:MAG: hypothetical protein ACR2OJ_09870 [Hyphomicrobiales bacterium]
MSKAKIFLTTALAVGLTAGAMAALAPQTQSAAAVLTSDVNQRMHVVHKMPANPFEREVMEIRCNNFSNCQEI